MATTIRTELLVGEGMWHGFHWEYEMPESIAAMKAVVSFLDSTLRPNHAKDTP